MAGRGRGRGRGRLQPPPQPQPLQQEEEEPLRRVVAGRGVAYSSAFFEDDELDLGTPSTGLLRPREDATLSDSSDEDDDFIETFRRLHPSSGAACTPPSQASPPTTTSGSGSGGSRGSRRGGARPPAPGMEMLDRYPVVDSTPSSLSSPSSSISIGRGSSSEEDWSGGRTAPQAPIVEKRGDKGVAVSMCVNFIRLEQLGGISTGVWEYHVDFPNHLALTSRRLRWGILRRLDSVLGPTLNFDGGSKLFLPFQLPDEFTYAMAQHPVIPEDIQVQIKFIRRVSLEDSVHFYNILLRQVMEKLGLVEMQRNFFDYSKVFQVPEHKLEIWPGYVTAIEVYEDGLMLNCDSSFRVLRTDTMLRVLEQMFHMQESDGRYDARKKFRDYALGKIVLTKYNNKHYRVDDVDWESNPRSTFPQMRGGNLTHISFVDYYNSNYSVNIQDLCQPLLVTRGKVRRQVSAMDPSPPDNILLVPELCFVTGMTEEITSDFRIMKVVADKTRIPPMQRYQALQTFIQSVNDQPEVRGIFEKWGLKLADGLVELNGRVIAAPKMILGQGAAVHPQRGDFSRELLKSNVLQPIAVENWLLICSTIDDTLATRVLQNYKAAARPLGISYRGDPQIIRIQSRGRIGPSDYRDALKKNIVPGVTQFVVVIIPSNRDDLYGMIKIICNHETPVASQVIRAQTLSKENRVRSVMQKVALQINCKLGGALWTLEFPLPDKIMFLGMDVYHDPKRRKPSVTAVVATVNLSYTKYYTRVIFQTPSQENISSLRLILVEALQTFHEESRCFPDRIIMFRDGVGDGQLELTKLHEVTQMLSAFRDLELSPRPNFTFVVVQKRINARLFIKSGSHMDNAEPGTVLDHTVTRRCLFDFFLVSQLIREGTVNPTHYIVLHDDSTPPIPPNWIQKFAYSTSYMYYNWSGSIRVPAMCQYAHKAAGLVGQHFGEKEPANEMSNKLYYL